MMCSIDISRTIYKEVERLHEQQILTPLGVDQMAK